MKSNRVVLLGDSIFDNEAYVVNGLSVIEHVKKAMHDCGVCIDSDLLAVDGAVTSDIYRQFERASLSGEEHVFLSVGGNDALRLAPGLFVEACETVGESLELIFDHMNKFRLSYLDIVSMLKKTGCKITVCTIYDKVPGITVREIQGVALFNDVIVKTAFELGAGVIDLRAICNLNRHYSQVSPIEPSHAGGIEIAKAIVKAYLG